MKILVVGTWGSPIGWYLARYVPLQLKDPSRAGRPVSWDWSSYTIASHATTIALSYAFLAQGFAVYLEIYGLDTLAAPQIPYSARLEGDEVRANLVKEITKLLSEEFCCKDPESYDEIVSRAKKVLSTSVSRFVEEIPQLNKDYAAFRLPMDRVFIDVLPGIGTYTLRCGDMSKRYVFRGSPLNTFTAMFFSFSKRLREVNPDVVVLDISHGVNYLPTLAREAIAKAIEFYSALSGREIVFAIVNSDPVSQQNQESRIHLVEVRRIRRGRHDVLASIVDIVENESYTPKALVPCRPPEEVKHLVEALRRAVGSLGDLVKAIVKASNFGLALYIATKVLELDSKTIRSYIQEIADNLKNVLTLRSISINDNTITIQHPVAVPPELCYLIEGLEILEIVVQSLRDIPRHEEYPHMVELEALKLVADKLDLHDIARHLLNNELNSVRKTVEYAAKYLELDLSRPIIYRFIYESTQLPLHIALDPDRRREELEELLSRAERKICEVNERNFYAHAGLERNIVEMTIRNGKIYVGYVLRCRDKIEQIIR